MRPSRTSAIPRLRAGQAPRTIPAGAFSQTCLVLTDDVAQAGPGIVITKRGNPVAQLAPIDDANELDEEILATPRAAAPREIGLEDDVLAPSCRFAPWNALK
jgi:hypothetical protein